MLIIAESLYLDLARIYRENGWESKDIHFSLDDMKRNILSQSHQCQMTNKEALLEQLRISEQFNNTPVPEWVRKVIEGM